VNDHTTLVPMKIGILDSGVGGLSVMREIHQLLPGIPIHYVGDSSWCPYGNKSAEVINRRVFQITDHLIERGATLIVIACNSATIHSVGPLRDAYLLPIVGMEPGIKPAAQKTKSGVVGVLATEASIQGEKFHQLVDDHAKGVKVITRPCPSFVSLVEAGTLDGPEAEGAVREAVDPLLDAGADVLVLGCTHYPFLGGVIQSSLPSGVSIVDTGIAVAKRVQSFIPQDSSSDNEATIDIETTGSLDQLRRILPSLLPNLAVNTASCSL
jgi:glutamate racemase